MLKDQTLRKTRTLLQKLGDHSNFRKKLSEGKGHSRSSRRVPGYSRSSSLNSKTDSRNAKFHSWNGLSRLMSSTKTTILGATPGAILGIDGNPHERFSFGPVFSERFLQELGWTPRARLLFSDKNDSDFLRRQ